MNGPVDAALLDTMGHTPQEAAEHLQAELARFETALLAHAGDWDVPLTERRWSPAQLAEHLLKANESFAKVVHLLHGDKPLPDAPKIPSRIVNGKIVAPDFLEPGEPQPWAQLQARWQASHTRFVAEAADPNDPARQFWHPVFGDLDALGWTRAAGWHVRHHRRQLK